jgi:hypothetical protein
MADKASRRGAANLGTPLMLLAIVVIGGLFYWLFLQARDQEAKAASYPGAREIMGADLQRDPKQMAGSLVKVEPLPVASALGTQGFWLELPNKNPFLVSLDDTLKADSLGIQTGDTVQVVGLVESMRDSVANAWVKSGAITQGDKLAAQFATAFIQARHVEKVSGQAGGSNPGSGGSGGE